MPYFKYSELKMLLKYFSVMLILRFVGNIEVQLGHIFKMDICFLEES